MTRHVDIVVNEWAQGIERRVAVLAEGLGQVDVAVLDNEYAYLVPDTLEDPTTGRTISRSDPLGFLRLLPQVLNNSYAFATAAHEDTACIFHGCDPVALRLSPPPSSAQA